MPGARAAVPVDEPAPAFRRSGSRRSLRTHARTSTSSGTLGVVTGGRPSAVARRDDRDWACRSRGQIGRQFARAPAPPPVTAARADQDHARGFFRRDAGELVRALRQPRRACPHIRSSPARRAVGRAAAGRVAQPQLGRSIRRRRAPRRGRLRGVVQPHSSAGQLRAVLLLPRASRQRHRRSFPSFSFTGLADKDPPAEPTRPWVLLANSDPGGTPFGPLMTRVRSRLGA